MNFPLFLDSLKMVAVAIGALNKITTNKDK